MQLDLDNKEWQDALQIINFTRRSLFLTGKAGTGKSTFLRYVADHTKKKHVILAPTVSSPFSPSTAKRLTLQLATYQGDTEIHRRTTQTDS